MSVMAILVRGLNRHEAENAKFLRERSSDPLGPESCADTARNSVKRRQGYRRGGLLSCKLSPRCEATSDERSAGNLHATFCGSRGAGDRPRPPGGHQATGIPTAIVLTARSLSVTGIFRQLKCGGFSSR